MNRAELASRIAADLSLTRADADRVVAAVFAAIGDALAEDDTVSIAGLSMFSTKARPSRRGRNPRTGEAIDIAASRAPAFKAGKTLREAVNQSRG